MKVNLRKIRTSIISQFIISIIFLSMAIHFIRIDYSLDNKTSSDMKEIFIHQESDPRSSESLFHPEALDEIREHFHTIKMLKKETKNNITYEWKKIYLDDFPYNDGHSPFSGLGGLDKDLDHLFLNVSYGGKGPFYGYPSHFYWSIVNETYNNATGCMRIRFNTYDGQWNLISTQIDKAAFKLNFSSSMEKWTASKGDWHYKKENYYGKGDLGAWNTGITNLTVSTPSFTSDEIITWSMGYDTHWAMENDETTLDFNTNGTIHVNHTFYFTIDGNRSNLKVNMTLNAFNIHPQYQDDYWENGRIRNSWAITLYSPSTGNSNEDSWQCGDVVLENAIYKEINEDAIVTANGIEVASIDFGSNYLINETEVRQIITKARKPDLADLEDGVTIAAGIDYEQWFIDLNMSQVYQIDMDPEISTIFNRAEYQTPSATVDSTVESTPAPGDFYLNTTADNPDKDGKFSLNWTKSENAASYSLFWYTNNFTLINSSINLIGSNFNNYSYLINNWTRSQAYFAVMAYNSGGEKMSNTIKVSLDLTDINTDNEIPLISGPFYTSVVIISLITLFPVIIRKRKKIH